MIEQGVSLKTYNSFGVAAEATLFAVAKTIKDLQSILKDKRFKVSIVSLLWWWQ